MLKSSEELDFLDIISIMSFYIGLENLYANLTQSDKQDLLNEFNDKAELLLTEIHKHLEEQDVRLSAIEQTVKEIKDVIHRDFQ